MSADVTAEQPVLAGGFGPAVVARPRLGARCTEVPRYHWTDPSVARSLRAGEPVVLTGGCPLCSALSNWSVEHLRDAEGSGEERPTWPVHFTPRASFTRAYGAGMGEGGIREMTLDSLSSEPADGPFNLYLQALLAWSRGGERETRTSMGSQLSAELESGVDWSWLRSASEQAGDGDFEACQMWLSVHGQPISTPCHYDGASNFLAQIRGRKRIFLLHPSQTFRLYPYPVGHPLDNFAMADAVADMDGCSPRRPLPSHLRERFPAVAAARAQTATLEPGEVLFLPKFYWHRVEQLPPSDLPVAGHDANANLSLNFWLGSGKRALEPYEWLSMRGPNTRPSKVEAFWCAEVGGGAQRVREDLASLLPPLSDGCGSSSPGRGDDDDDDDDALAALVGGSCEGAVRCIHAARMVESAAFVVCGSRDVGGRFLTAIAAADDVTWPSGGSAAAFARRVRDEIADAVLAATPSASESQRGRAAALLLRLITRHGRLKPGLAPLVPEAGEYVSAERGDLTPEEEVARLQREAGMAVDVR